MSRNYPNEHLIVLERKLSRIYFKNCKISLYSVENECFYK